MKRSYRLLSTLLVAALAIGAAVQASAKETINVMWRDNAGELVALKSIADAFTKKYGINVKISSYGWGDGDDKLFTMVSAGIAPDLFTSVFRSGFADYARRGLCTDLTPFIKRDKLDMNVFYSQVLKHLKINGKYYGIPDDGGIWNTYYNTQLLQQAGLTPPTTDWKSSDWTWSDMLSYAVKLTKDTNNDGRIDQYGINLRFWPMNVYAWLWGGDFFPESIYDTGVATKCTVTNKACITGIEKLVELTRKYNVMGGTFVSGKTAMAVDGSWEMVDTLIAKPKFKMGVAVTPMGSVPRKPAIFTNPWMISKNSKHKEAAWKWIKFCTFEEGSDILANTSHLAPFNKRGITAHVKRFDTLDKYGKVYEGALALGQESPNHTVANFSEILVAIEAEVAKATSGKVSAVAALQGLEPKLNSILARTAARFTK